MSNDLYSGRVLELAAMIPHVGSLADPGGQALKVSRLCGSEVSVDVMMDGDLVSAFAIEPKACALGQASASVLARNIIGLGRAEIAKARDQLKAMLKDNGPPPDGFFWELRYLQGVADYPPRHTSVLLAFEAALAAIDQAIEAHALTEIAN
jgi:NifU-like protein involved in Fe-S cluster formation